MRDHVHIIYHYQITVQPPDPSPLSLQRGKRVIYPNRLDERKTRMLIVFLWWFTLFVSKHEDTTGRAAGQSLKFSITGLELLAHTHTHPHPPTHPHTHSSVRPITQPYSPRSVLMRQGTQWVRLICVALYVHNSDGTQAFRASLSWATLVPSCRSSENPILFEKRDSSCLNMWKGFLWKRKIGKCMLSQSGFEEGSF